MKNAKQRRRVAAVRPIREQSWLGRILRGSRELHIDYVVDVSSGYRIPWLVTYVDHSGAEPSDGESAFSTRMQRLYGIALADSWYELALTNLQEEGASR